MVMKRLSMQGPSNQFAQVRAAREARKVRLQHEEARYTMVLHSARKKLDISINEYCFADSVHKLSTTHSPVPGWCFASKEQLGQSLGVTRQSIHSMINRLKAKGLIEVDPATGYLRSSQVWRDTVEVTRARIFAE